MGMRFGRALRNVPRSVIGSGVTLERRESPPSWDHSFFEAVSSGEPISRVERCIRMDPRSVRNVKKSDVCRNSESSVGDWCLICCLTPPLKRPGGMVEPWVVRYLAEQVASLYCPLWCIGAPLNSEADPAQAVSSVSNAGLAATREQRASARSAPLFNELICGTLERLPDVRPQVLSFPDGGAMFIESYASANEMMAALLQSRVPHLIRGLFDRRGVAMWRL